MIRRSPIEIYKEARESIASYLDTAYRIGHPLVAQERGSLVRQDGIIAQKPFVETTSPFLLKDKLSDIVNPFVPTNLARLFTDHALGHYPLYSHQQRALSGSWNDDGSPHSLVIATGTGSGKTESFLLPILADIMREAETWPRGYPDLPQCGTLANLSWSHRRLHENRSAAIRAIILYPMNALVNDQASRLRRILCTDPAMQMIRREYNDNFIYFGQYTSRARVSGHWSNSNRVAEWRRSLAQIQTDWASLSPGEISEGDWIRPEGPEMYCRWDMQAAPPDILITNYAMLEYMLLRPLERNMWDSTRDWLNRTDANHLTIVLDEAHMYTGARGSEVAYLLRRLYDRIGLTNKCEKLRCIATSASLGDSVQSEEKIKCFASRLFALKPESFEVIRAETEQLEVEFSPDNQFCSAMVAFQNRLDNGKTLTQASESLINTLGNNSKGEDNSSRLANLLRNDVHVRRLQYLTARKAIAWEELCDQLWARDIPLKAKENATAGILAVTSYARQGGDNDRTAPPLVPTRLHMMFRGIPGIWACMRPDCPEVDTRFRGNRPCGKLYTEPKLWCACGARVLEVFTCRFCGLLFLGGIPDDVGSAANSSLWPYESDLEGLSREEKMQHFKLFLIEEPRVERGEVWRSWATTRIVGRTDQKAVRTWDEPGRTTDRDDRDPRPRICPRCNGYAYRRESGSIRHVIEPLDTMGHQAFAVLSEEFFRLQPGTGLDATSKINADIGWGNWNRGSQPPEPAEYVNSGRKLITFSDGRQYAAVFAGDLTYSHRRDVFRQLMLLSFSRLHQTEISTRDLNTQILQLCIERAIDPLDKPDGGGGENFWELLRVTPVEARRMAEEEIWAIIRREITDRQLGLEALGLARWVPAPGGNASNIAQVPPVIGFEQNNESSILVTNVIRILAAEDTVLPHNLDPHTWNRVNYGNRSSRVVTLSDIVANGYRWHHQSRGRLARYLRRLLHYRIDITLEELFDSLWNIIVTRGGLLRPSTLAAGTWGIPITSMAIASLPETVFTCEQCGFLSAETLNGICIRCGGNCINRTLAELERLRPNYYRRSALRAQKSGMPDPFPLHVHEHTGQITVDEALTRERHFKGKYRTIGLTPDDPYRDRVDVLSVTTTMELGIDIGDLSAVGMRNVPPTVANYQQRAGRAGRRGDGVASVFTVALHKSHDQYYFTRMADMVAGQIRYPEIHLENQEIAHRHMRAWLLDLFFQSTSTLAGSNILESWGSIGDYRQIGVSGIQNFIQQNVDLLKERLNSMVSSCMPVDNWLQMFPQEIDSVLCGSNEEAPLMEVLMQAQLLPRYGFPIDIVSLWTRRPDRLSEPIQRDRGIALSEYAPGGEIVVNGYIHRSVGLFDPFGDGTENLPNGWYYDCTNCRHVGYEESTDESPPSNMRTCSICNSPTEPRQMLIPIGFRTDWGGQRVYRGFGREVVGTTYAARLLLSEGTDDGDLILGNRLSIIQRRGVLLVANTGESGSAFLVCPDCGWALDDSSPHQRPILNHGQWEFRPCLQTHRNRVIFVHKLYSEIVVFRILWNNRLWANPISKAGRASLYSFGYAMVRAASSYLQVDPSEMAMGVRPYRQNDDMGSIRIGGDVFLYDTLPGGAGYAREIAANFEEIAKHARMMVNECQTLCDTACHRCLLDYANQRHHGLLDRKLSSDVLSYLLDGQVPSLTLDQEIHLIEHLQWFSTEDAALEITRHHPLGSFAILRKSDGRATLIKPVHTLQNDDQETRLSLASETGISAIMLAPAFELDRQPFEIWRRAIETSQ